MEEWRSELVHADFPLLLYVLFLGVILLILRPRNAAAWFVWGGSMPFTVFCYFVWIYGRGGSHWHPILIVIDQIGFAQIGWLGGALALAGSLTRWACLGRVGLSVSGVAVVGHGLFLILAFATDNNS